MDRREFLKVGAASATLGLSGCVEPVRDLVDRGDDTSNNSTNNTDNNTSNGENQTPEAVVYRDFIPTDGYRDGDGVFAFHVNLEELRQNYNNPYEAFNGLPLDENPVALSTGNALLTAEPAIKEQFGSHALRSDLLSALEFNDGGASFTVDEFLLVGNVLFFSGDVTSSMLQDTYGLSPSDEETDSLFTVYSDVSGGSIVGASENWMVIPMDGSGKSTIEQVENTVSGSDGLYDGNFGDAFRDRDDGTVNVVGYQDGVSAILPQQNDNVTGIASSAYFSDSLRTSTGILLSENDDAFVSSVGDQAVSRDTTREGNVVTVETVWN